MEKILILGMGGHAKSITDVIERENKYEIAGYVVNNYVEGEDIGYPILGTDDDLFSLFKSGIRYAAMGIGYLGKGCLREKLYEKLKKIGFALPIICDPSAIISRKTRIGEGTFIGKGVIINAGADIGNNCIINSGTVIEHDCVVGDFSHISVGAVLCGNVVVGSESFIGANATVIQSVDIGNKVVVGAGEVLKETVNDKEVYHKLDLLGGGYKTSLVLMDCEKQYRQVLPCLLSTKRVRWT